MPHMGCTHYAPIVQTNLVVSWNHYLVADVLRLILLVLVVDYLAIRSLDPARHIQLLAILPDVHHLSLINHASNL